MIYAEILAGGMGTRMGNADLPKQFLKIANKPIIIHTIEQFVFHPQVDITIVCCPKNWISYMKDLLNEYLPDTKIEIVEGGASRDETLMNGCKYIQNKYGLKDDDIVVTHDSVRPFVTKRLIDENIEKIKEYNAINTVVSAVDTIVESLDGKEISSIPNRKFMFQGQSPQTFYIKELIELYTSLTEKEKEILTDACKIYSLKNKKIGIVYGETFNLKITNIIDLKIAETIYFNLNDNNKK